jgi:hypothetical protein
VRAHIEKETNMTALASQLITVENQTKESPLSAAELRDIAWGLNYQALYHYGRSPWVEHGYAPPAYVTLLPEGAAPPAGAWNLILLDTSTQAGALGFHEDETNTEIPFSDVFVGTARENNTDPCEVASHEMLEMLVDPNVNEVRKVLNKEKGEYFIVEVADPVQGCGYDVGAPEGRHTGVTVADFVFPAWFGMTQTRPDLSFRDSVQEAFELAPEGYISVAPEKEPEKWSQVFGKTSSKVLPSWASRLPRIHS